MARGLHWYEVSGFDFFSRGGGFSRLGPGWGEMGYCGKGLGPSPFRFFGLIGPRYPQAANSCGTVFGGSGVLLVPMEEGLAAFPSRCKNT